LPPTLQTPTEAAARRALEELEASYAEQRRQLEEQLEDAKVHTQPIWNGPLYGTSVELENAVAAVLKVAGLTVVKLDELLGDTTSADLLVSWWNTLADLRRRFRRRARSDERPGDA